MPSIVEKLKLQKYKDVAMLLVPKALAYYQSLTPGYQKDWARYVYSAKQEATKEKRRNEMEKSSAKAIKAVICILEINKTMKLT